MTKQYGTWLRVVSWVALVATLLCVLGERTASAFANNVNSFPTSSCFTCHDPGAGPPLNKFGMELSGTPCDADLAASNAKNVWATSANCKNLYMGDPDNDGIPNSQEIASNTDPGQADQCAIQHCPATEVCTETPGQSPYYACTCPAGFQIVAGQCADIDECANGGGGCGAHSKCVNTSGSHYCPCDATFVGNGSLNTCACPTGFVLTDAGDGTQKCLDIDECSAKSNGGCAANSLCTNLPGSYTCPCNPGFFGDGKLAVGCSLSDVCKPGTGIATPCSPLAMCTPAGASPKCAQCPDGYAPPKAGDTGYLCNDVDECATNNGGCDPRTTCTNTPGYRSCGPCPAGFAGDGVQGCVPQQCNLDCSAFASCTVGDDGQSSCKCRPGFEGDGKSCVDTDECKGDPCAGAACTNLPGTFSCACAGSAATLAPPPPPPPNEPPFPRAWWLAFAASTGLLLAVLTFMSRALGRRRPRVAALAAVLAVAMSLPVGCGGSGGSSSPAMGDAGAAGSDGADSAAGNAGHMGSAGKGSQAPGDAGNAGAAGSSEPGAHGCKASCECAGNAWCNPATAACEPRVLPTPVTFDDVRGVLARQGCTACHYSGGPGDVDPRSTGFHLLLAGAEGASYASIVSEGVGCAGGTHRICVDEPARSLFASQTLDSPAAHGKPSVAFDSWSAPDLQLILKWIASGAARGSAQPTCGDGVLQDGEECDDAGATLKGCAYGVASCAVCDATCKKQTVAGHVCGDHVLDPGYEACDDGNLVVEEVGPHGGATCGPACTLVPGKLCGAEGLACCSTGNACGADEACTNGVCKATCGVAGTPCCTHAAAAGHNDGCRDYAMCQSGSCVACGTAGTAGCSPYTYHLAISNSTCDNQASVCDYSPSGSTCTACGGSGQYCCYLDPGNQGETCGGHQSCQPQHYGLSKCGACGGEGQDCCCTGSSEKNASCLGSATDSTCDTGVCVYHSVVCTGDICGFDSQTCHATCGALNQPCCAGTDCQNSLYCNSNSGVCVKP